MKKNLLSWILSGALVYGVYAIGKKDGSKKQKEKDISTMEELSEVAFNVGTLYGFGKAVGAIDLAERNEEH